MIFFFVVSLTIQFVLLDFITYCFGKFMYIIGFVRFGFNSVAKSLALTFGKCHKQRKWLYENCPYNYSCLKCRLWTCPGYDERGM